MAFDWWAYRAREDPIQAAYREVDEEVGVPIEIIGTLHDIDTGEDSTELFSPRYMYRSRINDTHEHVTLVYFAKALSDTMSPSGEAREQTETKWVTSEELETMDLRKDIRFYAQKALEQLSK